MNTSEILFKAADVIDEAGWYRRDFYARRGTGMCAMAAVFNAAGLEMTTAVTDEATRQRLDEVRVAIERLEKWLGVSFIVDWNDAPNRTAEQVTSALRECAASLTGGAP